MNNMARKGTWRSVHLILSDAHTQCHCSLAIAECNHNNAVYLILVYFLELKESVREKTIRKICKETKETYSEKFQRPWAAALVSLVGGGPPVEGVRGTGVPGFWWGWSKGGGGIGYSVYLYRFWPPAWISCSVPVSLIGRPNGRLTHISHRYIFSLTNTTYL